MNEQITLDPVAGLTPRQRAIYEFLREHRDGITAEEAGAAAHTVPGPRGGRTHSIDERCEWDAREGTRLLRQLVDLGVVLRRRGGGCYRYVPADGVFPAETPAGMLADDEELPF